MSNRLEEVLKLAATEPAHRPEFSAIAGGRCLGAGRKSAEQFDATSPVELQHWEKEGGGSVITSEAAMSEAIR